MKARTGNVLLTATLLSACGSYGPPGQGGEKVAVCHKGKTLWIAEPAVDAHLKHGDTLGPCR